MIRYPHPTSNYFSSDFGNSHDPAALHGSGRHVPPCIPVATLLRVIGLKPSNSAEPWFPATRTRRKTSREIGKAAFAKRHLQFKRLTVTASASTSSFTEEIPECYLSTDPVKTIRKENYRGRVCRYNWHSAGSRVWPFPMLKYKYIFRTKNIPKQFYQTALGNCYGLKLPNCWLQFFFKQ